MVKKDDGGPFSFTVHSEEGEEVIAIGTFGSLAFVAGLLLCCSCCCWSCCWPKPPPTLQSEANIPSDVVEVRGTAGQMISREHLRAPKKFRTVFLLWLFGGLLGVHHFYLERVLHGLLAMFTLNWCGIGWLIDFARLPCFVDSFNRGTSCFAKQL
mmetsp:Transcript_26644/g.61278  ORF Transcript_26644/g.61278 Transcript_26644/m.61278 type:complete len:155 (+) Transcript_26644:81-545(+)